MKITLLDILLLIITPLPFVLLLVAVTGGLFYARQQAFIVYGDQAAQSEWDAWREDAKELAKGTGPVARRAPKSVSPPALVLMRDYFGICLTLSLLLSSVLFFTTLVLIRGAFTTAPFADRSPPEPAKDQPDAAGD